MPLLNNPEVQAYLQEHRQPVSNAFRQMGLVTAPSPQFHFSPGTSEYQIPSMLGDAAGRALDGKQLLRPVGSYLESFHKSPGRAALLSALGLGGAGALYGAFTGRDPLTSGLVGAGIGAAGGYGLGTLVQNNVRRRDYPYQLLKNSYYVMNGQDPMSYIQERLLSDNTMTADRRANLMMAVQNMPQQQQVQLADVLRASFGAAVGYVVGRFVLNMGGIGTSVATGLGGMLGLSTGDDSGTFRNAIGLPVRPRQDLFGNPRLV
jgi:hypothetical protein